MLLCEPNLSEGRDDERIGRLVGAIEGADVELLHASSDPDHHRLVLAYRGDPLSVLAASVALAERAIAEIDLREHRGAHPRVGALDVVPFVRSGAVSEREALDTCTAFAREIAARGLPVFFYERAARDPRRRALPDVRRGEFEGLSERMRGPSGAPDVGPACPHPTAGAVITGVRDPLVRFNVNLSTTDLEPARRIARAIRASSGGLPGVRALGIPLHARGLTQVSMNVTRYRDTALSTALARVFDEADALGVEIAGTEAIGPIPRDALDGLDRDALDLSMSEDQVLDLADAHTEISDEA
ncbi:MAG: glutamate formimidoyltransferase [Gemmatimonadetes bacterium]|nr:glutamate formimidoyltransferase [Gemmatimonadota bacterium]